MDREFGAARREVEQRIALRRWLERIARWKRSGKDERLFCQRERIGLCSFRWWIKELETRKASAVGEVAAVPSGATSALGGSTGGPATPVAQRWARCLEDWKNSGLSQVDFCRRKKLSIYSLRWWKWRLGRDSSRPGARAPVEDVAPQLPAVRPWFVPVEVVPGPRGQGDAPPQRSSIDVFLRGKRRVRVVGEFDAALFARVVSTLEAVP
jgi:hypothetical protein